MYRIKWVQVSLELALHHHSLCGKMSLKGQHEAATLTSSPVATIHGHVFKPPGKFLLSVFLAGSGYSVNVY
jgi:hypothetical protein